MRIYSVFIALLIIGCATTAKYEAKIRSWKGKDAETLEKVWGQPDATEKLGNGNKMFVYARLKHRPLSFSQLQNHEGSEDLQHSSNSDHVYIKCATYFEINPQNKVAAVDYRGDDCVSRD